MSKAEVSPEMKSAIAQHYHADADVAQARRDAVAAPGPGARPTPNVLMRAAAGKYTDGPNMRGPGDKGGGGGGGSGAARGGAYTKKRKHCKSQKANRKSRRV